MYALLRADWRSEMLANYFERSSGSIAKLIANDKRLKRVTKNNNKDCD